MTYIYIEITCLHKLVHRFHCTPYMHRSWTKKVSRMSQTVWSGRRRSNDLREGLFQISKHLLAAVSEGMT